jgi:hypothetical protein
MTVNPKPRWSPSQLNSAALCPQKWAYQSRLRIGSADLGPSVTLGGLYGVYLRQQVDPNLSREVFDKELARCGGPTTGPGTELWEPLNDYARVLAAARLEGTPDAPPLVEGKLVACERKVTSARLDMRGYTDFLCESPDGQMSIVIETKLTGKAQTGPNPAWVRQLRLYVLALQGEFPDREVRGVLDVFVRPTLYTRKGETEAEKFARAAEQVRTGKSETKLFQTVVETQDPVDNWELTRELDRTRIQQELLEVLDGYDAEDMPRNPYQCDAWGRCEFYELCHGSLKTTDVAGLAAAGLVQRDASPDAQGGDYEYEV